MTYGVNTFAAGSESNFTNGTFDGVTDSGTLVGTATYNGDATGMYALKDFSTGAGVPSEAGQFTADAGTNKILVVRTVALSMIYFHISGTVTGFKNAYGAYISNGAWAVSLQSGPSLNAQL